MVVHSAQFKNIIVRWPVSKLTIYQQFENAHANQIGNLQLALRSLHNAQIGKMAEHYYT